MLQQALNYYLALDPETKYRLQQLQGKVVAIELLGLAFTFKIKFTDTAIELSRDHSLPVDTFIKGTPLSLLHMTLAQQDRKRFFAEEVMIEGDLELGQQVIDFLDNIEIDWEEIFSHWLGDVPVHQLGRLVRNLKNFSQRVRETVRQNIDEYVHEEVNLFPPPEALEDFFQEVDALRMDVDRLEARLNKMTRNEVKA